MVYLRTAARRSTPRLRRGVDASRDRRNKTQAFLTNRHLGDRVIDGRVEAFSCKRAGDDKKLSKQLERQYADEASSSPASLDTNSPLGALGAATTRRLLIDLISTMNASFPDHDFSGLRPEQFCREASAQFASVCRAGLAGRVDAAATTWIVSVGSKRSCEHGPRREPRR